MQRSPPTTASLKVPEIERVGHDEEHGGFQDSDDDTDRELQKDRKSDSTEPSHDTRKSEFLREDNPSDQRRSGLDQALTWRDAPDRRDMPLRTRSTALLQLDIDLYAATKIGGNADRNREPRLVRRTGQDTGFDPLPHAGSDWNHRGAHAHDCRPDTGPGSKVPMPTKLKLKFHWSIELRRETTAFELIAGLSPPRAQRHLSDHPGRARHGREHEVDSLSGP